MGFYWRCNKPHVDLDPLGEHEEPWPGNEFGLSGLERPFGVESTACYHGDAEMGMELCGRLFAGSDSGRSSSQV